MYGVICILQLPNREDPKMMSLEVFASFKAALERSREIVETFMEEYDAAYIESATEDNPVTVMSNGEVTGYAFIQKVKDGA